MKKDYRLDLDDGYVTMQMTGERFDVNICNHDTCYNITFRYSDYDNFDRLYNDIADTTYDTARKALLGYESTVTTSVMNVIRKYKDAILKSVNENAFGYFIVCEPQIVHYPDSDDPYAGVVIDFSRDRCVISLGALPVVELFASQIHDNGYDKINAKVRKALIDTTGPCPEFRMWAADTAMALIGANFGLLRWPPIHVKSKYLIR